jgi:hypothetical protein
MILLLWVFKVIKVLEKEEKRWRRMRRELNPPGGLHRRQ